MSATSRRRQARLEARVRFGPERSALSQMLREAKRDLKFQEKSGRAIGRLTEQAVDAAKPEIVAAYKRAGGSIDEAEETLSSDLRKLSTTAGQRQSAIASRERTAARQRLASSLAAAEKDLAQQKIQGRATGAALVVHARGEYSKAKSDINTRRKQLAKESGAFQSVRIGELRREDRIHSLNKSKFRSERYHRSRQRSLDKAKLRETRAKRRQDARQKRADRRLKKQKLAIDRQKNRRSRSKAQKETIAQRREFDANVNAGVYRITLWKKRGRSKQQINHGLRRDKFTSREMGAAWRRWRRTR